MARAARNHWRGKERRQPHRRQQVDLHQPLAGVVRRFVGAAKERQPRVVNQHVYGPAQRLHLLEQRGCPRVIAEIGGEAGQHFAARRSPPRPFGHGANAGSVQIGEDEAAAEGEQLASQLLAKAARRAGYQHNGVG